MLRCPATLQDSTGSESAFTAAKVAARLLRIENAPENQDDCGHELTGNVADRLRAAAEKIEAAA